MDEELDLLKAIYCSTSEFCKVDNNHPPIRKIEANIKVDDELFVNTKVCPIMFSQIQDFKADDMHHICYFRFLIWEF